MAESVRFAANGGTCDGWLAQPAGRGRGRAVVVIQEWWGLNDQVKGVAERLAQEGFTAIAPDLYHGRATNSSDEAAKLLMALEVDAAARDLHGAIEHLRTLTSAPVGVVGFCMGGALSLYAACANGPAVGACVIYYGGHRKVQPHFDGLTAPVLGHWAEKDDSANASARFFAEELRARGKSFAFHTYPGTVHAFANERSLQVYNHSAAETAWRRTIDFFIDNL